MSYFASKRPITPQKQVRKNNKTESCKAVWDYGFHSETFKTTNSSDYTNKTKEMLETKSHRQEPRDHLWFLNFDDSSKFLDRERSTLDCEYSHPPSIEKNYQSQMKANFTVPGYPKDPDVSQPAGKITDSNNSGFQYSSGKLVDILDSVPVSDFNGHNLDIFLPPSEQCKRFGLQTWMDYPEKNTDSRLNFPDQDVALMRLKKKTQLTVPIAGK